MCNTYCETVMIINPKVNFREVVQKYQTFFVKCSRPESKYGVYFQDEGMRMLAYSVKGYEKGHYIIFYYVPVNRDKVIKKFESLARKDKAVLKQLTVNDVDLNSELVSKSDRII